MNREILVGKTVVTRMDISPGVYRLVISSLGNEQKISIDSRHVDRFRYVINELAREEIHSP